MYTVVFTKYTYRSKIRNRQPVLHTKGSLIIHDLSLSLAPLRELKEGDGFKNDASFDSWCGILVESKGTFYEERSLDEPSVVDFSDFTPHMELNDSIYVESFPNLAPIPPISPLSSSVPILRPSLYLPKSTFVESETFVSGNLCLDQTFDDSDI